METQRTGPGKNAYVIRTVVLHRHSYRMGDVKILGTKNAPKKQTKNSKRQEEREQDILYKIWQIIGNVYRNKEEKFLLKHAKVF